jgi:hypothetical protein
MKFMSKQLHLLITILLLQGCDKESPMPDCAILTEAFVIGFDQCLVGLEGNNGRGFLLATEKDTLMTYNLPDSIYTFPEELFTNWWLSPFFPEYAVNEYKLMISYRYTRNEELISAVCPGFVVGPPPSLKPRQVTLICLKK